MIYNAFLRLGCGVGVGVVTAAVCGIAPATAATMVAVAHLISLTVRDTFKQLPDPREGGVQGIGTLLVGVSWYATMAQVSQIFVKTFMRSAVPFYPSFWIVSSALVFGDVIASRLNDSYE